MTVAVADAVVIVSFLLPAIIGNYAFPRVIQYL